MQLYQAYADYHDMMNLAEELVVRCALAVNGNLSLQYQVGCNIPYFMVVHMFLCFEGMAFIGVILKWVATQNNSSCCSSKSYLIQIPKLLPFEHHLTYMWFWHSSCFLEEILSSRPLALNFNFLFEMMLVWHTICSMLLG